MRASGGLRGALAAAQVVYGRLPPRRLVGATRGIVGLMLAASSAEAIEARGVRRGGGAVAAAGALGFAAELAGVATGRPFGHYTYSGQLGPRVGGVPLLAAAAWAMMARPSWVVAGLISRRRAPRIALAAGALTAWDVFLDPRMAREGYWSWPGGGRYEGVPASNFLGWFVTGAGVFAVWSMLDGDDEPLVDGDGALALYTWTWVGETFANAVLWRRPVVAAGGLRVDGRVRGAGAGGAAAAMSRVVVIGAGVGGLAAAIRLAHAGHAVTVLEQAAMPGGKCGHVSGDGFSWDSGPSLLTLPWVFEELFEATGAPLATSSSCCRSSRSRATASPTAALRPVGGPAAVGGGARSVVARRGRRLGALPGDVRRDVGRVAPVPDRPAAVAAAPPAPARRRPPGDLLRVKPWWTLRQLARAHARDPRLRMVIERFATYAGADPRRAPAALAVAGYVEHAFGAWHPRGGLYGLVEAMARRLDALGGELRLGTPVRRVIRRAGVARGVETAGGLLPADVVIANADPRPLAHDERSLSGFALMLGLRGRTAGLAHHAITFPADYDAEFDDVFVARRPVREPALYVSAPSATDPGEAPRRRRELVRARQRPRGRRRAGLGGL